jgi:hypothetical protein
MVLGREAIEERLKTNFRNSPKVGEILTNL